MKVICEEEVLFANWLILHFRMEVRIYWIDFSETFGARLSGSSLLFLSMRATGITP